MLTNLIYYLLFLKKYNHSSAWGTCSLPAALHRLQHSTACKIQNGRGGPERGLTQGLLALLEQRTEKKIEQAKVSWAYVRYSIATGSIDRWSWDLELFSLGPKLNTKLGPHTTTTTTHPPTSQTFRPLPGMLGGWNLVWWFITQI